MADPIDEIFQEIWRKRQEAQARSPPAEEPPLGRCVYNQHFEALAQQICQKALQNPSLISLNQAMLLVFQRYMEWKIIVPKAHRNQIGERGHRCIFHVLESAYYQLKAAELALSGVVLFEVPQQPQPLFVTKKYYVDQFPIGETTVGDDEDTE